MHKKIFLFILLFICFSKISNAEVIYGEYYKVDELSGYQEDEIKKESYKIFNTYDIFYDDMGYMEENDIYVKDEDDFIYEKQLTDNYNIGDEVITINLSNKNKEKVGLKLSLGYGLKIYELEIFHKGEKIDYDIGNKSKFDDANLNISNINDNDFESYYFHDTRYLYIFIKFFEEYNLDEIEIVIHTKKDNNSILSVYFDNRPIVTLNNDIDRKHIVRFNIEDENVGLVEYNYYNDIKLYKYYKINKVIKDIYVNEGNNLILEDYKIINEYYKRDKIVLSDNLIVDDKSKNVYDFIEYSSENVDVLCDINYEINGIYKCRFKLNDLEFEKDIIVDIKDNLIEMDNIHDNEIEDNVHEGKNYKVNEFENIINKETEDIKEVKEEEKDKLENSNFINKEIEENHEVICNELVNLEVTNIEREDANNKNRVVSKKEIDMVKNYNKQNNKKSSGMIKNNSSSNFINKSDVDEKILIEETNDNNTKIHSNKNLKIIFIIVLILINIYMLIKRIRYNVESI